MAQQVFMKFSNRSSRIIQIWLIHSGVISWVHYDEQTEGWNDFNRHSADTLTVQRTRFTFVIWEQPCVEMQFGALGPASWEYPVVKPYYYTLLLLVYWNCLNPCRTNITLCRQWYKFSLLKTEILFTADRHTDNYHDRYAVMFGIRNGISVSNRLNFRSNCNKDRNLT
jgi:hypothetical protein